MENIVQTRSGPPLYWMNECGGELKAAMLRYLDQQPLSRGDVHLIRLYIQQWITSEVWDQNPCMDEQGRALLALLRESAFSGLRDREGIDAWLALSADAGLDPL